MREPQEVDTDSSQSDLDENATVRQVYPASEDCHPESEALAHVRDLLSRHFSTRDDFLRVFGQLMEWHSQRVQWQLEGQRLVHAFCCGAVHGVGDFTLKQCEDQSAVEASSAGDELLRGE